MMRGRAMGRAISPRKLALAASQLTLPGSRFSACNIFFSFIPVTPAYALGAWRLRFSRCVIGGNTSLVFADAGTGEI